MDSVSMDGTDDIDDGKLLYDVAASDDEDCADVRSHNKMLAAIGSLDDKNRARNLLLRTEPLAKVSEYYAPVTNKLQLQEMVGALQHTSSSDSLRKQLNKVKRQQKVLAAALSKPEQEKVQRTVAYEATSNEISKWDPVVQKNRQAEQLVFPLKRPDLRLATTDQFVKRFQPHTDLEKEVASMLQKNSDNNLPKNQELTESEKRALRAMDIQEAKERRAELQKFRVLLSYKEAKQRRQKKIKSKKYRRILRKDKMKEEAKKLDALEKNDHEAYLQKLEEIDKSRMEERMSLKHRGGSKFMQRRLIYSKYDDASRQQVQEMLRKSRELTQKRAAESDSEDEQQMEEEEDEEAEVMADAGSRNNPWMSEARARRQQKLVEIKNKLNARQPQDDMEKDADKVTSSECAEDANRLASSNCMETIEIADDADKLTSSECAEDANKLASSECAETIEIAEEVGKQASLESVETDVFTQDAQLTINEDKDEIDVQGKTIDEIFNSLEKKKKDAENKTKAKREKKLNRRAKRRKVSTPRQKVEKKSASEAESDSSEEEYEEAECAGNAKGSAIKHPAEDDGLLPSTKRRKTKEDFEREMSDNEKSDKPVQVAAIPEEVPAAKPSQITVDPKKAFTIETKMNHSQVPDMVTNDEDNIDVVQQQRLTIAEAFASDDVLEEFAEEKQAIEDRDKPKAIDMTLPGWGSWGGTGLKVSNRKRKRFTILPPPAPPRKDRDLNNVIISETKDNSIAKHQVVQLPFPFSSVHQFESSIRQPIGKTWNPETTFHKLIKPKVVSKLGTIIQPIDKTEVFTKNKQNNNDVEMPNKTHTGKRRNKKKGGAKK